MYQIFTMQTRFKDSKLYKALSWLFVNSNADLLRGSKILGLLNKINSEKLAIGSLVLSLGCFWYGSFFAEIGLGWVEGLKLGMVFLALAFLSCDKSRLQSTRAMMYLLLFIVIVLASGLVASLAGIELGMVLTGILLFSQFILAFMVASTIKSKMVIINLVLAVSVPLLLVGLFQVIFGPETSKLWVSGAEDLVRSRAFAFFGSPNVLGGLSMITAIVALFAFLGKKKWYYMAYIILSMAVLVMTFSRSAWLGLLVGVVVALFIKNWRLVLFLPLAAIGLVAPSIRQRVLVTFSPEYMLDSAIDGRVWSFNNAIEIFKTSPVLGTGPGTYGGQTAIDYNSPIYLHGMQNGYVALPYTDNQWLQVFVQTGIIGALAVAGFFISHFVNNLRQYRQSHQYFSLGIIAATVAVFVNGMFANIWEFGAISILAGAYLGLGNSYEK
ncbi:MAG: O-antigen ligase family protein [Candidatus Saccharibacteria bacterium]